MSKPNTLRIILSYSGGNTSVVDRVNYSLDCRGDIPREEWADIRTRWEKRAKDFWGDNAEWVNNADQIFGGYWRDKVTRETLTLE
jgi:hypothetical protein